jgi:uncharacterized protein YkwD
LKVEAGHKAYMKTPALLPLFVFALLLAHVENLAAQSTATAANSSYEVIPGTVNRARMLQLVNEVRHKGCQCGDTYYYPAPPLVWNNQLELAAYKHTDDMAKHHFFSHYAPDGSRGGDRMERAGYHWKSFGENIGEGYKTEKEMLDGWLASPGHCKNIMNKTFTEMGVSRVGTLWTQVFGSR